MLVATFYKSARNLHRCYNTLYTYGYHCHHIDRFFLLSYRFRQSHRGYHRSRTRLFQGLLELLNSAGRRTLLSEF